MKRSRDFTVLSLLTPNTGWSVEVGSPTFPSVPLTLPFFLRVYLKSMAVGRSRFATKCHISNVKIHQIRFPARWAYSAPETPSWIKSRRRGRASELGEGCLLVLRGMDAPGKNYLQENIKLFYYSRQTIILARVLQVIKPLNSASVSVLSEAACSCISAVCCPLAVVLRCLSLCVAGWEHVAYRLVNRNFSAVETFYGSNIKLGLVLLCAETKI